MRRVAAQLSEPRERSGSAAPADVGGTDFRMKIGGHPRALKAAPSPVTLGRYETSPSPQLQARTRFILICAVRFSGLQTALMAANFRASLMPNVAHFSR